MLISEIRGKLNFVDFDTDDSGTVLSPKDITRMEDVLTGNVFGIIKNIDYCVLNKILIKAGIPEFNSKPYFNFWHSYKDGTEPDLIIENDEMYVVVEVKYQSDFDKGNTQRKPQIIREIEEGRKAAEDRKFYYLAVTKEEKIHWYGKISNTNEYGKFIEDNINSLYQISWDSVFQTLVSCLEIPDIDTISKNFLCDLIDYLKIKEIGYVSHVAKGERPFQEFFGEDSNELFELITRLGKKNEKNRTYEIYLTQLRNSQKEELYTKLHLFIDKLIEGRRIKELSNTAAMDKIPINLLYHGVDKDERKYWFDFIDYLFSCRYINLNGQSDISAKLHFIKGNYTKGPVSLFTYYRTKRMMEFRELR